MDDVLRHVAVVGEELLGVFRQAVAAVAERRIVVVVADARVEAHAFDDLAGIHAVGAGIGVELVEEGHPHGEVGVGKQLDRLGLGAFGDQHRDVFLDCALLQQAGEDLGAGAALADDDA